MHLFPAVHQDDVGFDPGIGRPNDAAVPQTLGGLNSIADVDFSGSHGETSLILGVSLVSPRSNWKITKVMAERVGFEFALERKFNDMQRTGCAYSVYKATVVYVIVV